MGDLSVTHRVADRMRLLRAQKRWSARQLAEACAQAGMKTLTRSAIAKIESGVRKSITADEIAVLAQVLGVSPSELIDVTTAEQTGESAETVGPLSSRRDESGESSSRRRDRPLLWSAEVPYRNPYFTGRERELAALREQLASGATAVIGQPPKALYGLGGVGKSEIAAEYAQRFSSDYDVVWWIRADQEDSIRAALVRLGRQLGLPEVNPEERDYSSRLVLDALQTGNPYQHWLLIFDNATQPGVIGRYLPQGRGHVIITSRISQWRHELRTDGIEITEFAPDETVQFLRRRIPQLSYTPAATDSNALGEEEARRQAQAERLAETLGNLPLAAEHAAAYLEQTGEPVDDYIAAFERDAHELLSRDADMFSAHVVASTWNVARETLTPEARDLFQILAFFAPEPISAEILVQPVPRQELPPELAKVLSSNVEFRRAARELSRFSLAKINGVRNIIQMHSVVQAVTRRRIEREDPEAATMLRETVHALLAASDPGDPEKEQNDPIYERSIHHLIPSDALESGNPLVRNLVINQVRRLHRCGRYKESLSLSERTLSIWREKFGPDDIQTLALSVEVGIAYRSAGLAEQAYELNSDTLERLSRNYGQENETTLFCASSHTADLRFRGQYYEAINTNRQLLSVCDRLFPTDHLQTLNVRQDIATDLRCLGDFTAALGIDEGIHGLHERTRGIADRHTLISMFAVARDLRQLGRYAEALDLLRQVIDIMEAKDEPWHLDRLLISADFGTTLRHAGFYQDALEYGEAILARHQAIIGHEHRQSLVVATNLINDRRLAAELVSAEELGKITVARWQRVAGTVHPNTCAAISNLAVVLRLQGEVTRARQLNEQGVAVLKNVLGEEHPHTLAVQTNLASDMAVLGETKRARDLGLALVKTSLYIRGNSHPNTLAATANLALDCRACGEQERAAELHEEALGKYLDLLGSEHPITRQVAEHERVDVDIEPMSS